FGWWDGIAGGRAFKASRFRSAESLALRQRESRARTELQNDLETVVAAHHPEITRLISAMRRAGASHAAMSGSGSAVFGLFARRTDAIRAAETLASSRLNRGITTLVTR